MTNQVEAIQNVNVWKDKIVSYVVDHSGQLIGAVIIFVVGLFAARWVGRLTMKWLSRKENNQKPETRNQKL